MNILNYQRQIVSFLSQKSAGVLLTMASTLFMFFSNNVSEAAVLDSAIAQWQFAEYETLGTGVAGMGTATVDQNETGTLNDVRDLNGNQSWMTRYFNGSATGATVGNNISGGQVKAVTSDYKSVNANTGSNYLIRNLSGSGEELIPTTNTSYTVFARVFDPVFNGIDDIFHVGAWSSATTNYYGLQTNNGTARFLTRGAGQGADSVLSGPTLVTNKWYDITGVFDSLAQSMTLYVYDPQTGLQVGSTTTLGSLGFSSLTAGSSGNSTRNGGMFFAPAFANGDNDGARADLVAVWNTALSQNQVASLSALPPVPEPSTAGMLLLGVIGMAGIRRRSRCCHAVK